MNSSPSFALVFIVALFLSVVPVSAKPYSPWLGGSVVSTRGFSENSGFPAGEYANLGLFFDPFQHSFLNPSASIRWLTSLFPFNPETSMIEFGLDLDLFSFRNHPLKGIMYQDSALGSALAASWAFSPSRGIATGDLFLTAHILRLRTGDARYTLLSPELLLRGAHELAGWGLRLFEFSYFLF